MRLYALLLCLIILWPAPLQAGDSEKLRLAVADRGTCETPGAFQPFATKLGEVAGIGIDLRPLPCLMDVAEALEAGRVDLVLAGPAEYVVLSKRTKAQPLVALVQPEDFSLIVVLADEPVSSPKDLRNRKIAVGEAGSARLHLGPLQLLADGGLDPRTDLKVIHAGPTEAWEALKRGSVTAVGLGSLAFRGLLERERSQKPEAFRVIARGGDLPPAVLIAGNHVRIATLMELQAAFVNHSRALAEALPPGEGWGGYQGVRFVLKVRDESYDSIRRMFETIGYPGYGMVAAGGRY